MLKEKLKLVKDRLKYWHQSHTQNLEGKIKKAKDCMSCLYVKAETQGLAEDELGEINFLSSKILSLSKLHASVQW